jgi:hypothetical protein
MAVILQDLYGLVSHKQMALVAGEKGLNRPVRWLHMVESVDIASFLEGDEIAFVTGIGLKQPGVKAVLELVRAIYDHGASAIVLNVGPYIPAIPESVRSFCDDVALPLFQVPWDVHMAELMHVFSTEITERERLERDMQQAFETAVMKPVPAEPYLSVFSKYGFRPELPYRLLVLCPGREAAKTQTDWLEKVRFSLDNRMKHGLFPGESCLWLLTTCCDTGTIQQRAEQWLSDGLAGMVGVSDSIDELASLSTAYEQASLTLRLQRRQGKALLFYDELGAYTLLFNQKDPAVMERFSRRVLHKAEEYDRLHDSALLEVLTMYLQMNGSVQKTADALHIHRNTVNYKLHKLADLLNCDLSDFSVRFTLQLALMIKETR